MDERIYKGGTISEPGLWRDVPRKRGARKAANSRPLVPCPKPTHPNFKDLTGRRFSRLTVTAYAGRIGESHAFWCECDCGKEIATRGYNLTGGYTQSCGCLWEDRARDTKTTHGLSKSPEAAILNGMKMRCHNPNVKSFPRYGGRGISVCDRWRFGDGDKSAVECFLEDMGPRPTPNHSIDRYPDQDGNYEPGNCRWATASQQEENKPSTRMITFQGRTQTVHAWARETGIPIKQIVKRLHRDWSVERALTQPLRGRKQK